MDKPNYRIELKIPTSEEDLATEVTEKDEEKILIKYSFSSASSVFSEANSSYRLPFFLYVLCS
jgi:hypothetical protein